MARLLRMSLNIKSRGVPYPTLPERVGEPRIAPPRRCVWKSQTVSKARRSQVTSPLPHQVCHANTPLLTLLRTKFGWKT